MRHENVLAAALGLILTASLAAQPTTSSPNFSVAPFGNSIFVNQQITSMAVDVRGNVYLVEEPGTPAVGARVHRIRPNGQADPVFAAGFGDPGELAYNPADGNVYLVDTAPILPVINATLWRMDPTGATNVGNVPVVAQGFTIDNMGIFYLGGGGLAGPGLYRHDPVAGTTSFVSPGFGQNRTLQALVSGDVLIAEFNAVRRWTPGAVGTLPFYQAPPSLPNQFITVNGLARTPFNEPGAGAMIGVRDFTTLCNCGTGFVQATGLLGANAAVTPPFATENFGFPFEGLTAVASGVRQDLYWLDIINGFAGRTTVLYKIEQVPAAGSHGSLFGTVNPGQVTFDLYGRPAGGDPFTLGLVPAFTPSTAGPLFVPGFGIVELDPFGPLYLPFLDGLGLFGTPNPFAQIPFGGHFSLTITLPPSSLNLQLLGQALILDGNAAPNGLYTTSNVITLTIP